MTPKSDKHRVLTAICVASFLVPFMGSALNLALPLLVDDFSMSAVALAFVVSSYLIATAALQMPVARVADILGRRRMFLFGIAVFAAASFLSGVAWSAESLIAFRLLCGLGSALVFGTSMAILSEVFSSRERGWALGVNTAVVYGAVAAGPVFGGMLAQWLGWRAIFFVCAVWAAAAFVMAAAWIKDEWREAAGEPYDYRGAALFALSLAALILGLSLLPGLWAWPLLAAGGVGAVLFVKHGVAARHPVINLELFFTNRHFRLSSLSALINYSASFALGFILSIYLQYVKGMDAWSAGLVLMVQPAVQTLFSPLAGRLSDRINPSYLTTAGMAVITAALIVLTDLDAGTPVSFLVVILAVVGFGFAIFSSPNVNIIMSSVPKRHYSLASATTGTARLVGQSLSLAIATMAIHAHMGDARIDAGTSGLFLASLKTAFLIFAALCAAGVYTSASKVLGRFAEEDWRAHSARLQARDDDEKPAKTSSRSRREPARRASKSQSKRTERGTNDS